MQGEDANQPQENTQEGFSYQGQPNAPGSVFGGTEVSNNQPTANPDIFTAPQEEAITWEASEYLHHEKGLNWYLVLGGFLVVLIGLVYFFTRDIFASVVLLIIGVVVGVYAGRKPHNINYALDGEGLTVGSKVYKLDEFKSFSINHESGILEITFMPTKRLMPTISIYITPSDGDKIVGILSKVLPNEDYKPDIVDKFLSKIRF